jgi:hypothetical protein
MTWQWTVETLQDLCKAIIFDNDVDFHHIPMHMMIQLRLIPQNELKNILECDDVKRHPHPFEYLLENPDVGLALSARFGFLDALYVFKNLGATNFDEAMQCAAESGKTDIIKKCIRWGANDFENAMRWAAKRCQHTSLICLKRYYPDRFLYWTSVAVKNQFKRQRL